MFRILKENEREKIHRAALDIMGNVGVKVHNQKVMNLLLEAGAIQDNDHQRIYLPESVIKKYLDMCPKSFRICNRKGEREIIKNGSGCLYYTSNGTHYGRGTCRDVEEITRENFIEFIRVADRLENINGLVGTSIKEYRPEHRDFTGFELMSAYSYKHLRPCIYTPLGAEIIIEMADVILAGTSLKENTFFTLGYSCVSPLTWTNTGLELFYRTRGHGIPMMINSEPMAGGTSPVTLAGSLALADAEVISGIVINQIIEPGRPCIYNGGFAHILDMATTIALTGSPENALIQAAAAEMAEFHELPCASWALSDALMLDSQASYEKFYTLFAHTLTNVNFIWGIGNIETSKTISPEVAVIDNELIANCLRFSRGFKVDEEHIACDVIRNCAKSGSFLDTEHTFNHFREEIRHSGFPNRISRNNWVKKGKKSIEEKAEYTVNDILKQKPEIYLTGSQMDRLKKIRKKWIDL